MNVSSSFFYLEGSLTSNLQEHIITISNLALYDLDKKIIFSHSKIRLLDF